MSKYTQDELAHFARIKDMPCSLCGEPGPSDAHHILEGRTPGRKSPAYTAIPLCKNCHQGSIDGIHGQQAMCRLYYEMSYKSYEDSSGRGLEPAYRLAARLNAEEMVEL